MSLVWNKSDLKTIAEKKIIEVNERCETLIHNGIDVKIGDDTKHFSLTTNDQTNLDSMFVAVTLGAQAYPYHADGEQCTMYSAADIVTLYVTYKKFVTYQTTYCNMLHVWINREQDEQTIYDIEYGDDLPEDLEATMNELLQDSDEQIQAIISKMQTTLSI